MKSILYPAMLLLTVFLVQCKSNQPVFHTQAPFEYTSIYTQNWVGGQPGNAGVYVTITLKQTHGIVPDSMYYQGWIAPVEIKETPTNTEWTGRFQTVTRRPVNLSDNHNKPIEQAVPKRIDFPFDLKDDEVVLRYTEQGKAKFFKWSGVVQKEPIFYPSAKPQHQF
ncbi:MAG: hypothetical protein CR968_05070 [Flavobacteriia bacterium]|nr:MAG: hypothetical protein CR968_05070 [Flavobacteriia bacterium]